MTGGKTFHSIFTTISGGRWCDIRCRWWQTPFALSSLGSVAQPRARLWWAASSKNLLYFTVPRDLLLLLLLCMCVGVGKWECWGGRWVLKQRRKGKQQLKRKGKNAKRNEWMGKIINWVIYKRRVIISAASCAILPLPHGEGWESGGKGNEECKEKASKKRVSNRRRLRERVVIVVFCFWWIQWRKSGVA